MLISLGIFYVPTPYGWTVFGYFNMWVKPPNTWSSALDKLLGLLGIYATWYSSIAYLQKQLRIFYIFLRHVFGSDYIIRFLLNEANAIVPSYLLSSSAFLSIKLADFYCTWSKSLRLVDIKCSHPLCIVPFSAKILDWRRYFMHKLELYCALASKKNQ